MASSATSPQSVVDALRQTSKGRLQYDSTIGVKEIQIIVDDVKKKQNSLITVSPPQQHTPEQSSLSRQNLKKNVNLSSKSSKKELNDSSLAKFIEINEMRNFDASEAIYMLNLAEYDHERKRQVQANWVERKRLIDQFQAKAAKEENNKLEAIRREKYLHEQQQIEQEKAQRDAVIEEKRQWEQNLRLQYDQNNQRLNARVKEVELTQKRLEQQAAEKRQRDIQNQQNLDELYSQQKAITALYKEINSLLVQCSHKQLIPSTVKETLSELKDVASIMDLLISSAAQRTITSEDLELAKSQVLHVEACLQLVQHGVETANRQFEEQNRPVPDQSALPASSPGSSVTNPGFPSQGVVLDVLAQNAAAGFPHPGGDTAQQTPPQVAAEPQPANLNSGDAVASNNQELYQYISPGALRTYTRLQMNLANHQQAYEQLLTDTNPTIKKYRFDLQKAVNIPVNAISPLSGTHVRDKLERLKRLLTGQTVEVTEKKVSASKHPQAILMCKDLLAKKFVKQGEEQVSSKHESAFAFAATIICLWLEMADFGHLLLAHFHKKCPVIVPYYIPKEEGQSQEDHYRAMGYIYTDGVIEKQDKFLKRMSGMVRLYAAIVCSPVPRNARHPHPHGIENGWTWLTRILKLDPVPDLTATVLFDFLETAGSCLMQTYETQFRKLLVMLCKDLFPKIRQVTPSGSGGPVVRLESFLQKCLQCGRIPQPEGFLHNNFWYT